MVPPTGDAPLVEDGPQPCRVFLGAKDFLLFWFACVAAGKIDSTVRSSQAVPHPSTNRALRRLTSEVRRDPVHSTRYGRQQELLTARRLTAVLGLQAGTSV